LQATLSSISDGVIGLDHYHRLLLVNRSFCQEFRLDANRIHNQPLDQVVGIKHAGQTTSISQLINAMHHQHQSQQRFDLNLKTGLVEIEAIATINLLPDPTSQ